MELQKQSPVFLLRIKGKLPVSEGQERSTAITIICSLKKNPITQEWVGAMGLTILVEELKDGRLLGIEEEGGHVIVGLIRTKKGLDT